MKKTLFTFIAACAACCLLLLLIPVISGAAVTSMVVAGVPLDVILCALPLLGAGGVALYLIARRNKARACSHDGKCGCK